MANANLFQQYLQPVRSVTDYSNDLDKQEGTQLALQGQRRQNELAALTADQTRQTIADSMADRNALQRLASTWGADTTVDQRVASLRNSGRPALMAQADALEKQGLDKKKIDAEASEKNSKVLDESIKRYRTALDYVSTPQDAARWLQAQYQDPVLADHMNRLAPLDQATSRIPTDPQQFQQWRQQAGMGMEKYAEHQRLLAQQAETVRHNKVGEANAAGQLSVARDRLQFEKEQPKGQIVQTDNGPVLVDPRTGQGRTVTGPDGQPLPGQTKPLNESQSKALLFGSRARDADKVLQELSASGVNASIPGSRSPILGGVINSLQGQDHQSLDQAKRDFMTAVLRRESGASISPSEFETADKQYFPQVGDGPKVIQQKARNRALVIQGLLNEVPEKQRGSLSVSQPKAQLSADDQAALSWANSNPKDPRAAKIKQRLGM